MEFSRPLEDPFFYHMWWLYHDDGFHLILRIPIVDVLGWAK